MRRAIKGEIFFFPKTKTWCGYERLKVTDVSRDMRADVYRGNEIIEGFHLSSWDLEELIEYSNKNV